MKKVIITISVLFYFCFSIHAQWSHIYTSPNQIYAIDAINEDTVFAVGENTILRTFNGGNTWDDINPKIGNFMAIDIEFQSSEQAIISGHSGLILKTTDCGDNWFDISPSNDKKLVEVEFINKDTGWIISEDPSAIYRTLNGGSNWDSLFTNIGDLLDIDVLESGVGYLSGNYDILKTNDFGHNWISLNFVDYLPRATFFLDENTGYLGAQGGGIFKTYDGGDNWTFLSSDFAIGYFWRSQLQFLDADTGYYIGYDLFAGDGILAVTVNGGNDWIKVSQGLYHDIVMVDRNIGYSIKWTGEILKTTNGGLTSVEEEFSRNAEQICVYPNPFYGQISIELSNTNINCGGIYIDVYNQYGCRDLSMSLSKKALNKINAETLGSGIYYYKIYTPNEIIQTGKIIKTR